MDFWKRVDSFLAPGQTLKWLCCELNLNYKTILNLRNRASLPSIEIAFSIAQFFGTTIEYLISGKDPFDEPEDTPIVTGNKVDSDFEALVIKVLKKQGLIK